MTPSLVQRPQPHQHNRGARTPRGIRLQFTRVHRDTGTWLRPARTGHCPQILVADHQKQNICMYVDRTNKEKYNKKK